MKKFLMIGFTFLLVLGLTGSSQAFFIDFENGIDNTPINNITGVSFQNFNGYTASYGDSRALKATGAPKYNTYSDNLGMGWGYQYYHHNGYFWLWAGPNADARGVIVDFTSNDGTWFSTGYASATTFYVEAYLTDGSMVSTTGAANLNSPMGFLTVNATAGEFIDYIILHDSGNAWLVDDMSGDATGLRGVPEPATMLLLGSGLIGLVSFKRKFRKA